MQGYKSDKLDTCLRINYNERQCSPVVVKDPTSSQLPFDWNESEHLAKVERHLLALRLPHPPHDSGQSSWSVQCKECLDYVSLVAQRSTSLAREGVSLLSR